MVNAQEWLDKNYPKYGIGQRETNDSKEWGRNKGWNNKSKKREEITKLDISKEKLEHSLELSDFINLKEINCGENKLTSLNLSNCSQLEVIICNDNNLTNLLIDSCNNLISLICHNNLLTDADKLLKGCSSKNLVQLHLENNRFTGDLIPFSSFVNLWDLTIHSNIFIGSLKPLQNCTKLKKLDIMNTNIDEGLEWLPNSVEYFYNSEEKIEKHLAPYNNNKHGLGHRIKDWRKNNQKSNSLINLKKFIDMDEVKQKKESSFKISEHELAVNQWIKKGFNIQEISQWKEAGLGLNEYEFANHLKKIGYLPTDSNTKKMIKRESELWQDIHPEFNFSHRKNWEQTGIDYIEAKQWIELGFAPSKLYKVQWWKKNGFDYQEIKQWVVAGFKISDEWCVEWKKEGFTPGKTLEWINFGLEKHDHNFASYLQKENVQYQSTDIKKIKDENYWKNIHPDFDWKTRRHWEIIGLTSNETKELIELGFKPNDDYYVEQWIKIGFTVEEIEEIKQWISAGFGPQDYDEVKEWKEYNFTFEQAKQWIKIGFKYVVYAKEWENLNFTPEEAKWWVNNGVEEKNFQFADYLKQKKYRSNNFCIKEIVKQESWQNIHQEFDYQIRREWEKRGFNAKQVQKLINGGMRPKDFAYCAYLRDIKINSEEDKKYLTEIANNTKISEKTISQIKDFNHRNLSFEKKGLINKLIPNQELKKKYEKNGLCQECCQPNNYYDNNHGGYCQACNNRKFQQNFNNWTSGDSEIDKFIQKFQLEATDHYKVLEWIPYDKFTDVEYLDEGGFSKIYKAKNKKYGKVVLKILNNSQSIKANFLQEVTYHKLLFDYGDKISPCCGLSKDPQFGNYIIVVPYANQGNLRQWLNENYDDFYLSSKFSFRDKFGIILTIVEGIKKIHEKGLVHGDLHIGNILKDWGETCYITDLGLCRPANETNKEKIYGVLPYISPELLIGEEHTQANDIYSFGIITYEILTGVPPYYDLTHDVNLAKKICQGLRLDLNITQAPQLLKDLIKRCWNADRLQRPNADELFKILDDWNDETNQQAADLTENYTEFYYQYKKIKKIEDYNNKSQNWTTAGLIHQNHSQALYTSRLINTKEISELLKKMQLTEKNYSESDEATEQIQVIEKNLATFKESLTDELLKSVEDFIDSNKKLARNEEDEKVMEDLGRLCKLLEEKGLSEKEIENLSDWGEKLVKLEQWQTEQNQLQTVIEIPPK